MQMVRPDYRREGNSLSLPIFSLMVYMMGTFFPVIYYLFPFLGRMKMVVWASVVMLTSYILDQKSYSNGSAHNNPIFRCWLGILILMALGIVVSRDRGATLGVLNGNLKYFMFLFLTIKVVDSTRRAHVVFYTFAACGVGMSLMTIANYFTGQWLLGDYRAVALEDGRWGDPNDLALLLVSTLPFNLYAFFVGKRRLIPILSMGAISLAIILTFSRGGFLGLMAVVISSFLILGMKLRKILWILPLVVTIYAVTPSTYGDRLRTIVDWETDSETGLTGTRIDSWTVALNGAMDNIALGVGAGAGFYILGRDSRDWHNVHNSFIQIFLELGILGLVSYGFIYFLPIKRFLSRSRNNLSERLTAMWRTIIIAFLAFATTAFFLPQAYSPILYMLSSLAIVLMELTDREGVDRRKQQPVES